MSVLLEAGLTSRPVITDRLRLRATSRRRSRRRRAATAARSSSTGPAEGSVERLTGRHACSTPSATTCAPPSTRSARPGCYKPERVIGTRRRPRTSYRGGRRRGARTSAPTTTSASPTTPGGRGRARRRSTGGATAWRRVRFICGTQDDAQGARAAAVARSSAPRTRSSTVLLRRERRGLRDPARRARTRSSPTRSTTPRSSTASGCPRPAGYRYANRDMADLEAQLKEAPDARRRLIVTDGVFSMDGYVAPLRRDLRPRRPLRRDGHGRRLARRRLRRPDGRGTPELHGVDGPRRHRHRHPGQGARRRLRRLRRRARRRSSSCCASGPGRTCSPTRSPRSIAAASLKVLELLGVGRRLREPAAPRTPRCSAAG